MHRYYYLGPVMIFDTCVDMHFEGETYAESERKARSNLEYQWKKKHGYAARSKVSLTGKLIEII